MAVRYYYFAAASFDLSQVQARVPAVAGLAAVSPTLTQTSLVVLTLADDSAPNEEDLLGAMASFGYEFIASSLVAPPPFATRLDFGVTSSPPTVPTPAAGDRYYDPQYGPLCYDGSAWKGTQHLEVPFSYSSVSPLVLTNLRPADRLMRSEVAVDVTFDGIGASLELGSASSPGAVFSTADIPVSIVDTCRTFARLEVVVQEDLVLTIVPGAGATQGSGRVFLEIWRS